MHTTIQPTEGTWVYESDLPAPGTFSTPLSSPPPPWSGLDYDFEDDEDDGPPNEIIDFTYENCPQGWGNWAGDPDNGGWDMPDSWYD